MPYKGGYDPVFNEFLYAQIDAGATDKPLSLLSALSRLGVDPWLEAAQLAKMPEENASRRLASLIERLPSETSHKRTDAGSIAVRLLKLLPRGSVVDAPALRVRSAITEAGSVGKLKLVACLAVALYLAAFGLKWALFDIPDGPDRPPTTNSEKATLPRL